MKFNAPYWLSASTALLSVFATISDGAWGVYTSSFVDVGPARREANQIRRGLDLEAATYVEAQVGTRTFYRVRAAVLATRREAQDLRRRLQEAGYDSWFKSVPDSELPSPPSSPDATQPSTSPVVDTLSLEQLETSVHRSALDSMVSAVQMDSLVLAIDRQIRRSAIETSERIRHEVAERLADQQAMSRAIFVTQAEQDQITEALVERTDGRLHTAIDSMKRFVSSAPGLSSKKAVLGGFIETRSRYSSDMKRVGFAVPEVQLNLNYDDGGVRSGIKGRLEVEIWSLTDSPEVAIQSAYGSWSIGTDRGVGFTAGKFLAPIGLDELDIADRYSYSISPVAAYGMPKTFTGVLFKGWSGIFGAELGIVNGWDQSVETNDRPTGALRLAIAPSEMSHVSVSIVAGPEQADDNRDMRITVGMDAQVGWPKVVLGSEVIWGQEDGAAYATGGEGKGVWMAGQARITYSLSPRSSVSVRFDGFVDKHGIRTGFPVDPWLSLAVSPRFHLGDFLFLALEYRLDRKRETVSSAWQTDHSFVTALVQKF